VPVEEIGEATGLTVEQVERVFRDTEQKRRTTAYLHEPPALVSEVTEVGHH
jgi:NAD+ synthase